MHKIQRINGSWMPPGVIDAAPSGYDGPDFGWALFQLVAQNIDCRFGARAADMVATLAFLAGRIVQRAAFREHPQEFRIDLAANGVSILRSDHVSDKLTLLTHGTLASTLTEAALMAGARRFPDIANVRQEAQEAMQRRSSPQLRGLELSAGPRELARLVQDDVDDLLSDPSNRNALVRASIQACGFAVGYHRSRLCPAEAAELGLSVALYASWLDQREIMRQPA